MGHYDPCHRRLLFSQLGDLARFHLGLGLGRAARGAPGSPQESREIRFADVGGTFGRRPVLIATATEIISVLNAVTSAPITTSVRGIPTRVSLGQPEGLRQKSEAACEALMTLNKSDIDPAPLGSLDEARFLDLDRAEALALDIRRATLPTW
jgi:mRNA interferase MazF